MRAALEGRRTTESCQALKRYLQKKLPGDPGQQLDDSFTRKPEFVSQETWMRDVETSSSFAFGVPPNSANVFLLKRLDPTADEPGKTTPCGSGVLRVATCLVSSEVQQPGESTCQKMPSLTRRRAESVDCTPEAG